VSVATVAIAHIVAVTSIDFVACSPWRATQFHPRHLNVADIGVTVTRIEIEHGVLSCTKELSPVSRRWSDYAEASNWPQFAIGRRRVV